MRNTEKDFAEMSERREAMLGTGFRLFAENGIEHVSMQQVADACGVGVATLYRYFNTKLVFVIAIGTRKWDDYLKYVREMQSISNAENMTAAEEFRFFLEFYTDLYRNQKDILCFNQDFNNYVQHEGATAEQLRPYIEVIGSIGRMFHRIYEKAKKDGTLRTDMPEEKMFASTTHIMLAVAVRYAQGLLYSGDSEADMTDEMNMLKDMIVKTFTV